MLNKKLIVILMILTVLFTVQTAFATDINNTDIESSVMIHGDAEINTVASDNSIESTVTVDNKNQTNETNELIEKSSEKDNELLGISNENEILNISDKNTLGMINPNITDDLLGNGFTLDKLVLGDFSVVSDGYHDGGLHLNISLRIDGPGHDDIHDHCVMLYSFPVYISDAEGETHYIDKIWNKKTWEPEEYPHYTTYTHNVFIPNDILNSYFTLEDSHVKHKISFGPIVIVEEDEGNIDSYHTSDINITLKTTAPDRFDSSIDSSKFKISVSGDGTHDMNNPFDIVVAVMYGDKILSGNASCDVLSGTTKIKSYYKTLSNGITSFNIKSSDLYAYLSSSGDSIFSINVGYALGSSTLGDTKTIKFKRLTPIITLDKTSFTFPENFKVKPSVHGGSESTYNVGSDASYTLKIDNKDVGFTGKSLSETLNKTAKYLSDNNFINASNSTFMLSVNYSGSKYYKSAWEYFSITYNNFNITYNNYCKCCCHFKEEDIPEPLIPEMTVEVTNTTVDVTLPTNASGYVIVDVEGIGYYAPVIDGNASVNVIGLDVGNYTAVVTYLGDEQYTNKSENANITVTKEGAKIPEMTVEVTNTTLDVLGGGYRWDKLVLGNLSVSNDGYNDTGLNIKITVRIDAPGHDDIHDDCDMIYSFPMYLEDNDGNKHLVKTIERKYEWEPEEGSHSTTDTHNVFIPNDILNSYFILEDSHVKHKISFGPIVVVEEDEGDIDSYHTSDINITLKTTAPDRFDSSVDGSKFEELLTPTMNVNITDEVIAVEMEDNVTGFILVNVDDTGYYAQLVNGKTSIKVHDLTAGNHTVDITYTGDKNYKQINKTEVISVIKALGTIISEDLVKIEKNASKFEAVFTDTRGNVLTNKTVTFTINGKTYTRTTDNIGKAGMNINMVAGTYSVVINNTETNEVKINNIIVHSKITENHDLMKYYRNASRFSVRVLDDNGNPVKAGETVQFNINGLLYDKTTNELGYASIAINLQAGTYIVTSQYKNCKVSNEIKVLPVLSASDLTKKYGVRQPFTASLVDGNGKALANTNITFNINGMLYTRTTNANGTASLNINLQAGEYIITTSYNGCNIANKVTITS